MNIVTYLLINYFREAVSAANLSPLESTAGDLVRTLCQMNRVISLSVQPKEPDLYRVFFFL
jgi:hypothetical protein